MPAPTSVTKQRYKVVVLGPPAVGKTALVRRLVDGSFVEGARQRGLDFYTCQITLRDDVAVTLQLWDLSDCPCRPEDDAAPLSAYIFNCQAVLFVYDVSDPESLEAMRHALRAVESAVAAAQGSGRGRGGAAAATDTTPATAARPYMALLANKCDLQWAASEALARELAARHGCVRYTLSARSGQGISRAAVQLACDLAGVPLAAATEHAGRFQEPPQATEPEGLPSVTLAPTPTSGVPVGRQAPVLEACLAEGNGAGSGRYFSVRAPAYQTGPLQDFSRGGLDKLGLYGVGPASCGAAGHGGGGGAAAAELWRPISSSTTSSRAVTVIGKTDSLGLRVRSQSPKLLEQQQPMQQQQAASAAVAAAGADAGSTESKADAEDGGEPARARDGPWAGPGSGSGRHGGGGGGGCGWRALLCCLPARQRS